MLYILSFSEVIRLHFETEAARGVLVCGQMSSLQFFPSLRLHEEQKEMDILEIYLVVDSEGENKQYLERGSSLLKMNTTKKNPRHAGSRVFNLLCKWSNCQVNVKTLGFARDKA